MTGDPGLRPAATTVLVVEDDANVAEVLTRYLRREGYEVTCLDDGLAALELALAEPPDLAILDIMLPGMTGLELCRRLRAEMDVPIITLTALEFDLLAFLARHPREVFTREQLLDRVWGFQVADSSTVTVHVRRLRQKLEADPGHPAHLKTVWGVGYRFEA